MSNNDKVRAEISAIVADIEKVPPAMRELARQPDDREAYDIVARIERRLSSRMSAEEAKR